MQGSIHDETPFELSAHAALVLIHDDEVRANPKKAKYALSDDARQKITETREALSPEIEAARKKRAEKLISVGGAKEAQEAARKAMRSCQDWVESKTQARSKLLVVYGLDGENPRSFTDQLATLYACQRADEAAQGAPLAFSVPVKEKLDAAVQAMEAAQGKTSAKASFHSAVSVKNKAFQDLKKAMMSARKELYANLPQGESDPELRLYGFPVITRSRPQKKESAPAEQQAAATKEEGAPQAEKTAPAAEPSKSS